MKLTKVDLTFEVFDGLNIFVSEGIVRVYALEPRMAKAFGEKPTDCAQLDDRLLHEVQTGGFIFPVQEVDGSVDILEEDAPAADIIGYLVMTKDGMEKEGIAHSRQAAFAWLKDNVCDLALFMEGCTIQCGVRLNGADETYYRGPFRTIAEALKDLSEEFRFDDFPQEIF